jgi:ribosomal protein L4
MTISVSEVLARKREAVEAAAASAEMARDATGKLVVEQSQRCHQKPTTEALEALQDLTEEWGRLIEVARNRRREAQALEKM